MNDIEKVLERIEKSAFRRKFKLKGKEKQYLKEKGLNTITEHARDFIEKRLAPEKPKNDGRQTPFKNHPVFIAQHATATCCRSCLYKWHGIAKDQMLTEKQINYIVAVIRNWLSKHTEKPKS